MLKDANKTISKNLSFAHFDGMHHCFCRQSKCCWVTGEVPSSGPNSVSNFNFHSWSCSLAVFGSKATRNITQSNCRCLSLLMFQPVFQLPVTSRPLPLNLQCCCMAEREQPLASTKTFAPRSCRFGSCDS